MARYTSEYHRGIEFTRVDNSTSGNPRYVVHYLEFDTDYDKALDKARKLGFKKYRAKWYGGGFIKVSYDVGSLAQEIAALNAK